MKTLLRSLPRVAAAFALLALAPPNAWAQTTCDLVLSLADLAADGTIVDHKTDISGSDCTTQVTAKVDKVSPDETKIELKIDRSCGSTGQAQLTGIAIVTPGSPPTSSCEISYDNPADSTEVAENPVIAEVPELQQLILDAALATGAQFTSDPTAIMLVAKLTEAATPENIIFATAAKYKGDLGGLAGADAKCQDSADNAVPALPGIYKAWLSDSTISAKSRLTQSENPYVRTDGVQIAADFASLIDPPFGQCCDNIDAPLIVDENGSVLAGSSQDAWTGTTVLGLSTIRNCTNWTEGNHESSPSTGDPAFNATVGFTHLTKFHWTEAGNGSCGLKRHLYCLQQ